MNIAANIVFGLLLTSMQVAWAQTENVVPVVEVSDIAAPLRIGGRVIAKDNPTTQIRYSYEGNIELTNISSNAIVLAVVQFDLVSRLPATLSFSEEDDYFFESKVLQPGSAVKLQRTLARFGEPQSARESSSSTAEPSARARVVFVEFLDGSTWGDASAAERLLRARRLSLTELESLQQDYRTQGQEDFLKALLKPTVLQPILTLQNLYQEKHDVSAVLARLNEMLENARTRSGL